MALKNKSMYAILGILNLSPSTGYDIKKYSDKVLSGFWNENFGHIYPTLKMMLKDGMIMCCIGGFMSGYALLCRGNLGSAQTMNMIDIVFGIIGRNKEELLFRIIGLLLYFAGIEFVVLLSKKTKINLKRYSILVDMAAILVLAAIPDDASTVVGLLPMFFMLSTQWSVFSGTRGYTSSSVFSTNNFRQVILALNEYAFSKDKKQLKKAIFFINTLFWFHVNIAVSYYSVKYFSIYASLFGLFYAVPAFVITYMKEEKNLDTQSSHIDLRYAP